MAGCSESYTLDELSSLPVGSTQLIKGCAFAYVTEEEAYNEFKAGGFNFPENNEFRWAGTTGSCALDVTKGPPCQSPTNNGYAGVKGTIQRLAFTGKPNDCCVKQQPVLGSETCDPRYITAFRTADCDDGMLSTCSNFLFSSEEANDPVTYKGCSDWAINSTLDGRKVANGYMANACGTAQNVNSQICRSWCQATQQVPEFKNLCQLTPGPSPTPCPKPAPCPPCPQPPPCPAPRPCPKIPCPSPNPNPNPIPGPIPRDEWWAIGLFSCCSLVFICIIIIAIIVLGVGSAK